MTRKNKPVAPKDEYTDDVSAFGPDAKQVASIGALTKKQIALVKKIETTEATLEKLKSDLHNIRAKELPEAMLAANLQEFRLRDGRKIELTTETVASMSAENAPAGVKWLIANGHDGILKTEVNANLGKAALATAAVLEVLIKFGFGDGVKRAIPKLTELLRSRTNAELNEDEIARLLIGGLGNSAVVTNKTNAHAKTLGSFVKEQLDAGTKLPPAIKWTQIRIARIREPKAGKKGAL